MELLFSFAQHATSGPIEKKALTSVLPSQSLAMYDTTTTASMEPQDCTDVLNDVITKGGNIVVVEADIDNGRVVQMHLMIDKKRFEECMNRGGGFDAEEHVITLAKNVWREARTQVQTQTVDLSPSDAHLRHHWNDYDLFDHQKKTLRWLKAVEHNGPRMIRYPGNLFVTDTWYLDTECECFTQNPSMREAQLIGGVCADGTGTGKTATFLALVADSLNDRMSYPLPQMGCYRTNASLIIVPRNLVSQWQREVQKFLRSVKVHVLTTVRDIRPMQFILNQDIIITTMQFLRQSKYVESVETALGGKLRSRASLSSWARRPGQTTCILEAIEWRRIVVDEVHDLLGNPRELRHLRFMSCHTLWGISATPVLDNDQAQQLYVFLEREKNHHPQLMSRLIEEGVKCHISQTYQETSLVRVIMEDPPEMHDVSMRDFVQQSCTFMDITEEEENEDSLREHFTTQHEEKQETLSKRLISLEKTILYLQHSIKQCSDDIAYSQQEDLDRALKTRSETEQQLNFLNHSQTFLWERLKSLTEQQETCSICMEHVCGVILPCAHLFCSACIRHHLTNATSCPTCRQPATLEEIKGIPVINNIGVKMSQIGKLVIDLATESIIMFVQWKSMMKPTKTFLQSIGAVVLTLEGSVTRRTVTLNEFSKRASVLLLCLEESFAGLHLTHVSHVIFAHAIVGDIQTVKRLETQAIARCVRHGQKENVQIYSFVVANTEEERLWYATR